MKPSPILRQSSAASSSSSSSTSSHNPPSSRPKRPRNSFAIATASSLAHGGPSTMAPKIHHRTTRRRRLPDVENDDPHDDDSLSPSRPSAATSTPKKTPSKQATTPAKVLSPTPYYKVLAERNGETSPRLTRSAKKKQMEDTLSRLEDTLSPDTADNNSRDGRGGREEGIGQLFARGTGLTLDSSHAFAATVHRPSSRPSSRDGRELKRTKYPTHASPNNRGKKKQKTANVASTNNATTNNNGNAAAASAANTSNPASPNTIRTILSDCFATEASSKLTAAVEDKGKWISRCEEMERRCRLLEGELKKREEEMKREEVDKGDGWWEEERKKMQEMMDEERIKAQKKLEEERVRAEEKLKAERIKLQTEQKTALQEMEDKHHSEKREWEARMLSLREQSVNYEEQLGDLEERQTVKQKEWEGKMEQQAVELKEVRLELASVKQDKGVMEQTVAEQVKQLEEKNDQLASLQLEQTKQSRLLQDTKAQLEQAQRRHEELEKVHAADYDGAMTALKDQLSELRDENATLSQELSVAKSDLDTKNHNIATLQGSLEELQQDRDMAHNQVNESQRHVEELKQELSTTTQDLDNTRNELDAANSKLQGATSPRSRAAMEQQYEDQISTLQAQIIELESNSKQDLAKYNEVQEELKASQAECEELAVALEESQHNLVQVQNEAKENKIEWERQKNEMQIRVQEFVQDKNEKDAQMEELVAENEGLARNLEYTEAELKLSRDEAANWKETATQLEGDLNRERALHQEVKNQLTAAIAEIKGLESRVSSLYADLSASQQHVSELQQAQKASDTKILELSTELSTMTTCLAQTKRDLVAKQQYCDNFQMTERELLRENHVLNEIRRKLHNKVIQLSGNIRVFVRVRPMIESELQAITSDAATQAATTGGNGSRPSSRNGSRPSSRDSISRRQSTSKLVAKKAQVETDITPFRFPAITAERSTNSNNNGPTSFSDITKQTVEIVKPPEDRGGLKPRQKTSSFGFDRVFPPHSMQEDVWEGVRPLVQSSIDGFNVCLFAYGQTGSGKTHTMIGDTENPGLIPRSVQLLFETKDDIERKCKAQDQDVSIEIEVELLEIYNEEVRDLLSPNAGPGGKAVKVDTNSHEAVGNVIVSASEQSDIVKILNIAQSRRCVKATKSNAESSRSHLLFTIHFKVSSTSNDDLNRNGCLHIIDLAGSERLSKSGSYGALLQEAKHINKSLSNLTGVIEALQTKAMHVPFRDSKLTYLLRNSLGGDSKTLAIVCCSPQQEHYNESLNSLKFAAQASRVELKKGNKVEV